MKRILVGLDATSPDAQHYASVIAPFGGVLMAVAFAGSPSPIRKLYLQLKLRLLRGRAEREAQDALRRAGTRVAVIPAAAST